jgi:hypothetical protein
VSRRLAAALAWRRAALRPPWRPEPFTLAEHFGITAGLAFTTLTPYLIALKEHL